MIVRVKADESRPRGLERSGPPLITAAIAAAVGAGAAAAVVGPIAVGGAVVLALFGLVAWRPVLGTYLYLATLPFLAGLDRGALVPLLRPNEALLVLLLASAVTGGYIRAVKGAPLHLDLRRFDIPLAAFFLLATVWPIASMMLRGVMPLASDIAAIFPACKLAALFLLVRTTVRSPRQVLWCIRLIIAGAVALAAIAVLQTLSVGPVLELLETWWPTAPDPIDARGASTLTNPIATGDYIAIAMTLLVMSGLRGLLGRWARVGAGLVLAAGLLATGQFSTWLAALLMGVLVLRYFSLPRKSLVRIAPIVVLAALSGSPALLRRIGNLSGGTWPHSWRVRWDNLERFYIPELVEHGRFFAGVSPNSVINPHDNMRDVVYLESGYLQFLWMGGVPLLVAFVVLSFAVFKLSRPLRSRTDGVGACASTLAIAWWMVVFLSVLDAHLFMRGVGDLIFTLLGIVAASAAQERTDETPP
jgi:hypothetical protein